MKKRSYFHKVLNHVALTIICMLLVSIGLQAQEKLYWVSNSPHQVLRSNLDGTDVDIIINTLEYPTGLAIDTANEYLYVGLAGDGDGNIMKVSFDGTEVETLINTESGVSAIQLDFNNGKIYYALIFDNIIKRADLDGSNVETVIDPANSPNDFFIDYTESKIYWTDYFDGFIKRCNLDGSDIETLISDQLYPCHLFFDELNSKMYWSNYLGNNINFSNLDGTDHQVLISGLSYPVGITLDLNNNHIYWASYGLKSIKRADLDGANEITLYTSTEEDIVFWTLKSTIQNNSSAGNIVSFVPFELHQNFPNPFNPETTISYKIFNAHQVNLEIYNLKGQLVKSLVNKNIGRGTHSVTWNGLDNDGNSVTSGVYFYILNLDTKIAKVRKCLLLK